MKLLDEAPVRAAEEASIAMAMHVSWYCTYRLEYRMSPLDSQSLLDLET